MNRKTEKRKNTNGVTFKKSSVLLFFFAFFLSSFSMFVLGVYVGRGKAPVTFKINDIRKEIAAVDIKTEPDSKTIDKIEKTEDLPEKKAEKPHQKKRVEKKGKKTVKVAKPAVKTDALKNAFSIQVGAFRFENDADALVSKLKKEGFPAQKMVGVSSDKKWYRVRVGSFATRGEAKKLLLKLKDKKYDAFLVR